MKILINRKPVTGPWGGGNLFVSSFCDYMKKQGHEVVHQLQQDIDVIFMQDPRYSDLGISINEISDYKNACPKVKIVHRVNECDARKGTTDMDDLLRSCSSITDHTVFVSGWMKEYHQSKGWKCEQSSIVYNGVNKNHFRPVEKIKNGKVNLVTHHWSDNPMKGADIYDALDKWVGENNDYTFTYIGRYSRALENTNLIPPLAGKDLGDELGKYNIYISGSRFDPGPNHVIESIASGLPTLVHADGGGAVEFAGKHYSFSNFDDMINLVQKIPDKGHALIPHSWDQCMEKILEIIEAQV